mgnify:CR=1 FL=1
MQRQDSTRHPHERRASVPGPLSTDYCAIACRATDGGFIPTNNFGDGSQTETLSFQLGDLVPFGQGEVSAI